MSKLQIGDKVKAIDGSWSYSFCDGGLRREHGMTLKGEYEVVQTGLKMPYAEGHDNKPSLLMEYDADITFNDTLIREIGTGKIVSIQARFLRKIEPPKTVPKFHVGDKVVPVSKTSPCSEDWDDFIKSPTGKKI